MPTIPMNMVDGAVLATVAAEAYYVIGTNANTALPGSWTMMGDTVAMPARKLTLVPITNNCYVRIISYELYVYMTTIGQNPLTAAQIPLVVNQRYEFENVYLVAYQRNALADGELHLVAQA